MGSQAVLEETLFIPLDDYPTFQLENAICNHGFFMMAPNTWDPSTKCLKRPLRLADSATSVNVTISQPPDTNHLSIRLNYMQQITYSPSDKEAILAQVRRMLRLSSTDENDVQEFHKVHPDAKRNGFGRIFRSPSFFEDAIKCILLRFCNIRKSLEMSRLLCELQLDMSRECKDEPTVARKGRKRKFKNSEHNPSVEPLGNFPNAKELAGVDVKILKERCKGLRADHIKKFAKKVDNGKIKLNIFEECTSFKELSQILKKIKGFGCYTSANALMCLGSYQIVPVDTETRRHLTEIHRRKVRRNKNTRAAIKDIYDAYAPYQCLAFWVCVIFAKPAQLLTPYTVELLTHRYELVCYYEDRFGKLSNLPSSEYAFVSGSIKKHH